MLGYVAEQETAFRKQSQAEGITVAKAKGKHLVRPKATFPSNFRSNILNRKMEK